ncbi:hypothetical protein KM043_018390 [Ampulex compressa]|nr:hypothetical protein KM043_018390 [Ampulex compressa]
MSYDTEDSLLPGAFLEQQSLKIKTLETQAMKLVILGPLELTVGQFDVKDHLKSRETRFLAPSYIRLIAKYLVISVDWHVDLTQIECLKQFALDTVAEAFRPAYHWRRKTAEREEGYAAICRTRECAEVRSQKRRSTEPPDTFRARKEVDQIPGHGFEQDAHIADLIRAVANFVIIEKAENPNKSKIMRLYSSKKGFVALKRGSVRKEQQETVSTRRTDRGQAKFRQRNSRRFPNVFTCVHRLCVCRPGGYKRLENALESCSSYPAALNIAMEEIFKVTITLTIALSVFHRSRAGVISLESDALHRQHVSLASSFMHFHGPVEGPEFEVKVPHVVHHGEHNHLHGQDHEEHEYTVDYMAHPKYEFSYGVEDHHTGDFHGQKETRDGSSVSGEYSVKEPGGNVRVVSYRADKDGFHAVVHTSGKNDHSGGFYGGQGHVRVHVQNVGTQQEHEAHDYAYATGEGY